MKLLVVAVLAVLTGCATERGNQRVAQHSADQIRMVAIQKEAQRDLATKQAQANAALYEALARVAESNPDHAPSVAVALAVIGVSGGKSGEGGDDRIVTLQQQRNDALEWTKALAPTVGNLVSGLGVAAINASVTKNAQNANRDIMLGDQQQNARIVESVAGLGRVAVDNAGVSVGGSYYDLQDSASVDQSTNSSVSTWTETTTETSTDSSIDNSQTYDAAEDGFIVNGNYDYTYADDNAALTFGGEKTDIGSVVEYLQGLGQPYSLTLDGAVIAASSEGEGETVTIDCSTPQFSPARPECTGG